MNLKSILKNSILTEAKEIKAKVKPSSGLTKKQKSSVAKKAKAGKDIGHGGFEKLAKKAAKEYGSKESGRKVAAAAMWKNIKRKSIKENHGGDYTASMLRHELSQIIRLSAFIHDQMEDGKEVAPWIFDHLTRANELITQVGTHVMGEEESGSSSTWEDETSTPEKIMKIEPVLERKLTKSEKSKEEEIIKAIAKKKGGKDKLKGKDYAIATAQAKKSAKK
jgi:hypothetical protein